MPKKIIVNGIEVCVKEEKEFDKFCEMLKENIQIDDLEGWRTDVKFFDNFLFNKEMIIGL